MNIKKLFRKMLAVALCTSLLSGMCAITAMADTKITSVRLKFDYSTFEEDSDDDESSVSVNVNSSSAHYSIDETDITNMPDDGWNSGKKPILEITLIADDGYYFSSNTSSYFDFSGTSVSFSSASRSNSNTTLKLKVRLKAVNNNDDDMNDDLEVSDLNWDDETGVADWTGANDAEKYYLKLYRGSNLVSSESTTNTSYDFSSHITSTGSYYFKVRAYDGDDYGEWEESDTLSINSSDLNNIKNYSSSSGGPSSSSSSGAWLKDSVGWWYCNADRSYTINNWQYINNKWYYFNATGYMVTGWVQWKNIWYYCGSDGAMLTNTTTPDGYRVDGNGAWIQ